jgi:hypothetical protein
MATVSIQQSINVDVQQIPDVSITTNPSSAPVGTVADATGQALASPGELLLVQIGIENSRSEPNTVTITVTDSHANGSFLAQAVVGFDEGDDSTAFAQFSNFPLQADQVTPMDRCDYRINVVGSSVVYQVFAQ